MNSESRKYNGSNSFESIDEFKAPKLIFNEKKEYEELEEKEFDIADLNYGKAKIAKAIQLIKFSLDEKGGEIKSEAAIYMIEGSAVAEEQKPEKPRYFYVDNTFSIFLREKGQNIPYFAGRIEDISKFQ